MSSCVTKVMRNHVMVRVGGGWDTLERYFDKHDPCRAPCDKTKGKLVLLAGLRLIDWLVG